jgi:hypothetical protein
MNTKQLNWTLILGSVFLIIVSLIILDMSPFTYGILYYFLPVWFFAGVFGLLNFTKWPLWLKVVISIVVAPILMIALFFLTWGLNTGFRFTK